jgi:hypothetical protein
MKACFAAAVHSTVRRRDIPGPHFPYGTHPIVTLGSPELLVQVDALAAVAR